MARFGLCVWVIPILLLGCRSHARVAAPAADSPTIAASPYRSKTADTSKNAAVLALARPDSADDDLKGFYDDYIASYTRRCVIDSSFRLGPSHFKIHVEDSCLMDSAITIPKGYVSMYKLDSFVTHTFISKVRLEKDGKTILDRVFFRKDFDRLLGDVLNRYATIRCPNVHLKGDSILLGYSISIPLTDVGSEEYAVIDANGNVTFRQPGAED